jgi:hypothetical protein
MLINLNSLRQLSLLLEVLEDVAADVGLPRSVVDRTFK